MQEGSLVMSRHVCGHDITQLLQLFPVIPQLFDVTEQTEVHSADLSFNQWGLLWIISNCSREGESTHYKNFTGLLRDAFICFILIIHF